MNPNSVVSFELQIDTDILWGKNKKVRHALCQRETVNVHCK